MSYWYEAITAEPLDIFVTSGFYLFFLYTSFFLLYFSTNHIIFLFLSYLKYCNRLFYSYLVFLAPDEDLRFV